MLWNVCTMLRWALFWKKERQNRKDDVRNLRPVRPTWQLYLQGQWLSRRSWQLNFQKASTDKTSEFFWSWEECWYWQKEILVTTWCDNTSLFKALQSVSVCSSATFSAAAVVDPHHSRAARESRVCKPVLHNSIFWLDLIITFELTDTYWHPCVHL